MFVLVEMVDTVRTTPWQFERKLNYSIAEELNKKLANKVVYNVGLCVCLYDITKLEDSYIFPGDGASHTKVHFRYVVFHPFLDEILMGKIKGCSQEGVHGRGERGNGEKRSWSERNRLGGRCGKIVSRRKRGTKQEKGKKERSGRHWREGGEGSRKDTKGSISEPGLGLLSWWTNN
ncbi:DNA-directed RNA polymerase III subunit RPC8 [Mixophyes fleayi]|uniref:DNA-directed RNA polymerase III subunit RPC8 n=1 Tax=Mixophyes fleayi TaxID=3061075 RepID=UPI003F4D7C79